MKKSMPILPSGADIAADRKHPVSLWILKFLLLLLGLSALVSGKLLILDPSGKIIRFPDGYLNGSPFTTYLVPGILLLVFVGLLPIAAWYALWKKPEVRRLQTINPFNRLHWAWTLALLSGVSLVVWIVVQVCLVPYFFLQPVLLVWGILIVLFCFMPKIKQYYKQA